MGEGAEDTKEIAKETRRGRGGHRVVEEGTLDIAGRGGGVENAGRDRKTCRGGREEGGGSGGIGDRRILGVGRREGVRRTRSVCGHVLSANNC